MKFQFKIFSGFLLIVLSCSKGMGQNSTGMPSGNIGIGTTNPQTKLHVSGGHISATYNDALSGFVQLWADNAIIWKTGNIFGGLRFGSANDLHADGYSEKMIINDNGDIGIGIASPLNKLDVNGGVNARGDLFVGTQFDDVGTGKQLVFDQYGNTDPIKLFRYNLGSDRTEFRLSVGDDGGGDDAFVFGYSSYPNAEWVPKVKFTADGRVMIGTTQTQIGYKLFVEEGIRTRKIKVDQNTWADYVFSKDFRLISIEELREFILKNKHLPEIPTQDEIINEGLDLGEMNRLLLQKIEELTLYIIAQDNALKNQKKVNAELKSSIEELAKMVKDLKEQVDSQ